MSDIKQEMARELMTDLQTALTSVLANSFPTLNIKITEVETGLLITLDESNVYPTIHKATTKHLKLTEYGRERLRL